MSANLVITKAVVVLSREHADYISLHTTLPDPVFPFANEMCVSFTAAKGRGKAFIEEHFPGLPVEVIDTQTPRLKFGGRE